jgi:hypothetical protein
MKNALYFIIMISFTSLIIGVKINNKQKILKAETNLIEKNESETKNEGRPNREAFIQKNESETKNERRPNRDANREAFIQKIEDKTG